MSEISKLNKLEDRVLVQEFTISELQKKVQAEDTIKQMEKEIEIKDKMINEKDKQIIRLEDKIAEQNEVNMKTGTNFNIKEDQLNKAQTENNVLLAQNQNLNTQIEQLR